MKLEKCPFCGCKAILCSTGNHFATEKFFVSCGVCGVETPRIARTRKEAIAAWNRRAEPENKPLTLDELIACVGKPIYLVFDYMPEHRNGWYEFLRVSNGKYLEFRGWEMLLEQLGRDVNAYRRKPKEEV